VAARLSRYLQVLTQARKMGKERISSQEIAEYTNINATQIRRDLSAFGRFGKRGVGYRTEALLKEIPGLLTATLEGASVEERTDPGLIKEKIRVDLQRFFRKRSGLRPLVLPVVMEI